jgi:TRAP-type mannitol/chloroaromatic compound transport system permease large subunit
MSGLMIGLLGIVAFFILLIFRMPIGFAMAITGFVGFAYLNSPASALKVLSSEIFSNFTNYTLSEIPLFILMGFAAYHAGLGSKLYSFAYKLIGHFQED